MNQKSTINRFAKAAAALLGTILVVYGTSAFAQSWFSFSKRQCDCVQGSGKMIQESRPISGVQKLDIGTNARVEIVQGDKEGLDITADDNVMKLIESSVKGGILVISDKENFDSKETKVTITIKSIDRLTISGVSRVSTKELNMPTLDIDTGGVSSVRIDASITEKLKIMSGGASKVKISGDTKDFIADFGGASSIQATAMNAKNVRASGGGAAKANLLALDTLRTSVSGSSVLEITGSVKEMSASFSGNAVLQAAELDALTITLDGSGAARATVRAQERISGSMSGASRLKYYCPTTPTVSKSGVAKISRAE